MSSLGSLSFSAAFCVGIGALSWKLTVFRTGIASFKPVRWSLTNASILVSRVLFCHTWHILAYQVGSNKVGCYFPSELVVCCCSRFCMVYDFGLSC